MIFAIFNHGNRNFANKYSTLGIDFRMYSRRFLMTEKEWCLWMIGLLTHVSRFQHLAARSGAKGQQTRRFSGSSDTFLTWEASGFWLSGTLHVGPVKCGFLIRGEWSREGSLGFGC